MATADRARGLILAQERWETAHPLSCLATHPSGLVAFPTQAGPESLPPRTTVEHNDLGTFALGDRVFGSGLVITAQEGLEP